MSNIFYFFRFYSNLNFVDKVSKNTQISNFTKIRLVGTLSLRLVGTLSLRLDGRTDRHDDTNSSFVQFANLPKSAT